MKNWVVITGGAGYIGSHIAAKLKENPNNAILLIDTKGKLRPNATQYCDIFADEDFASQLIHDTLIQYRPTCVIHCAEDTAVSSFIDPMGLWKNNALKTANFLRTCSLAGVKKFIFLSSAGVYPGGNKLYTELDRVWPVNSLARNKNSIEHMLNDCYVAHSISSISFRLPLVAGCEDSKEIGPLPHARGIFPSLMKSLLLKNPFEIFGNDFNTPDGTPVRDFLHVSDLTDVISQSLEWLNHNSGAHIMNLASGSAVSLEEIVAHARDLFGNGLQYLYAGREPGKPGQLTIDTQLVQSQLNWKPTQSLSTVLTSEWKWYNSSTYCELCGIVD